MCILESQSETPFNISVVVNRNETIERDLLACQTMLHFAVFYALFCASLLYCIVSVMEFYSLKRNKN